MRYATTLIISLLIILGFERVLAQGCVAIRGMSSCSGNMASGFTLSKGEFMSGGGFRYFKSFRHFRGSDEEANRLEDGTEVINNSYFLDLSLNYGITDRLYGNIILPFVHTAVLLCMNMEVTHPMA